MDEIQTIINNHRFKERSIDDRTVPEEVGPPSKGGQDLISEIPNIFFDEILVEYKLNRVDTIVLMYLYRQVWCRPNLYKKYGISQILSHTEIAHTLRLSMDEIYNSVRKLEELGFVEIVRSGQYFVRKFFTEENDSRFNHTYSDF